MIVELVSVAVVLVGGCALLRTVGVTGWVLAPLGFLVGLCLQLAIGLVQVVTPLPTTPALTLAATGALPVAWWIVRRRQGHDVAVPMRPAAATLAAVALAVAALRAANMVKWHTDSLRYLLAGQLLADGNYPAAMSTHDLTKRLIGVPLLHAPAHLAGEYYLRSVTPLLAVATVAVLVWLFRAGARQPAVGGGGALFAALGVLTLVTNNRFVFSAFYLNGHLLFGALVLLVVGCGWLLAGEDPGHPRALMTVQVVALPALLVTRPEAPALVAMALLPTLLTGSIPRRHRAGLLAVFGATTVAWHGFMLWVFLDRGVDVPVAVSGVLLVGVLATAAVPLLRWTWPTRHVTGVLWAVEAGLWSVLAAFTLRRPDVLVDSVRATVQNVVLGAGRWGASLVVLTVVVLLVAAAIRSPRQIHLRFPVTTFLPLAFLFAYLREGGAYRVGYGDSLSRMFMQVVPLAVLYVIAVTCWRPETMMSPVPPTSVNGVPAGSARQHAPAQRPPSLARRVVRRARRELAGLRRTTVRQVDRDTVRVSRHLGIGAHRYRLDDPAARWRVRPATLRLRLPDASALVRLAASGLLTGQVRGLDLRLAAAPEWLLTGVRLPRLGRTAQGFSWRRRGRVLAVRLRWSRPYDLHRAFTDLTGAVLRARPWDRASGPVHVLDRSAWLDGGSSWPQGRLAAVPPDTPPDALGRPLGPYLAAAKPGGGLAAPIVTAVANPYGRTLLGAATPYRLVTGPDRIELRDRAGGTVLHVGPAAGPEAAVASAAMAKYAVVTVDAPVAAPGGLVGDTLRTLAACGVVFAAPDPAVRAELDTLGVVTVRDAGEVADLPGYALSVEAARRMAVTGDAALRRTALAGDGVLPLPTISVLLSSKRAEHVETCLGYLAAQTYPALEVVLGLHGYDVPEDTRQRWQAMLSFPVRIVPRPATEPFGAVLGRLSRVADGELVTKVDDDDHYGCHHITDLLVAWHTSGADLVAKGARFVHFPERDETIDRAWAAPELFDVTPAGGTMLLSRGTLQQLGGWSHSSKHVDEDLLTRIRSAGGLVYRTHALEYAYVRRTSGHTFVTDIDELARQAARGYPGLPAELIHPRPVHNAPCPT